MNRVLNRVINGLSIFLLLFLASCNHIDMSTSSKINTTVSLEANNILNCLEDDFYVQINNIYYIRNAVHHKNDIVYQNAMPLYYDDLIEIADPDNCFSICIYNSSEYDVTINELLFEKYHIDGKNHELTTINVYNDILLEQAFDIEVPDDIKLEDNENAKDYYLITINFEIKSYQYKYVFGIDDLATKQVNYEYFTLENNDEYFKLLGGGEWNTCIRFDSLVQLNETYPKYANSSKFKDLETKFTTDKVLYIVNYKTNSAEVDCGIDLCDVYISNSDIYFCLNIGAEVLTDDIVFIKFLILIEKQDSLSLESCYCPIYNRVSQKLLAHIELN